MNTTRMNDWHKSTSVMAMLAIVATGISFSTSAVAQTTLVGQCRAAKLATAIFKEATATSAIIAPLKMDDKVTLAADTAKDGLIAVSAPSKGFVQTVNLKPCSATPIPKPDNKPVPKPDDKPKADKGTCRLVAQAQGLVIRQDPATTGAVMGEAPANSQVTLSTNPATAKTDTTGRVWVEIAAPQKGWISNGFAQGSSNLVYCK